jgi:sialidase-1
MKPVSEPLPSRVLPLETKQILITKIKIEMKILLLSVFIMSTFAFSGTAELPPVTSYISPEKFMGAPAFRMEELFEGRGGRNIIITPDGVVSVFHRNSLRQSKDGGRTWGQARHIGDDVSGKNSVFNENTGEILLFHPNGHIWKSRDYGQSWVREEIEIRPNSLGHGTPDGIPLIMWAMQPGITLQSGEYKGRLLLPSRIWRVSENPRVFPWHMFQYSNAVYSDDDGKTWQSGGPFPDTGTGEGAIAELSDGTLFYASRKHYFMKQYPERFTNHMHYALGYDGGENWEDLRISHDLPDGPLQRSEEPHGMNFNGHFGLMPGLIRLPVEGADILIYSNVDSPSHIRQRATAWVSFDGGETWPFKRLVYDGPSAYSVLAAGRAGTPTEGNIYMLFEGGPKGPHSAVNVAVFNLGWLLEGQDLSGYEDVIYGVTGKRNERVMEKAPGKYSVGDLAHGGVVFWVDETGRHGLVCPLEDQSEGVIWARTFKDTHADRDGIYKGKRNTAIIIAAQEAAGDHEAVYAARICNELVITMDGKTYDDWYLPSTAEVNLMWKNRAAINRTALANGGRAFKSDGFYWSSNEYTDNLSWIQLFHSVNKTYFFKSDPARVRAVRSF